MAFCLRGKSLPPLALSSLIPPFGKDDLRSCLTQSEASLLCRAHVVLCVCVCTGVCTRKLYGTRVCEWARAHTCARTCFFASRCCAVCTYVCFEDASKTLAEDVTFQPLCWGKLFHFICITVEMKNSAQTGCRLDMTSKHILGVTSCKKPAHHTKSALLFLIFQDLFVPF